MNQFCASDDSEVRIVSNQELEGGLTQQGTQEEVRKYLRLLPGIAEPNLARVREIKEEIQRGVYPTREMIDETASRLALRFLRKE